MRARFTKRWVGGLFRPSCRGCRWHGFRRRRRGLRRRLTAPALALGRRDYETATIGGYGALVEPGQDRSIIDELYERVRGRLLADPQRYTMRNIEVAMLLTREP
jgi:hypothetical protein